ncbi:MAG TPA: SDR family oxidoreductase [Bradyrhizobium sp.]|nr:SDR family oxidoreductase [Bradyrhizobium sp.]
MIDTNLNGTCYMMQAAAQRWRDRKHPGSIVNIVVVTTHGLYGIAHTIAARSGVIALSRSVAVEWAPLNIRVNCVAPGAIETEGWNVYMPQARTVYPRSNPMMRAGSPWDIAQACVYLAGPSGGFITGETLTVDGGGQLERDLDDGEAGIFWRRWMKRASLLAPANAGSGTAGTASPAGDQIHPRRRMECAHQQVHRHHSAKR